jgi:glycosyltransferase involved in cell wall biosynthesis
MQAIRHPVTSGERERVLHSTANTPADEHFEFANVTSITTREAPSDSWERIASAAGPLRMTVSIVIPVYNQERFLAEAVESALAQSLADCEVVVVDDGSTDGSPEILRRYPQVRVVRQVNRGLAAARNAGLDASRGEVVIFLDADDRLWPDAAATGARLLAARPDAMMVFGQCRLVNEDGVPMPTNLPTVRAHFYDELLRDNFIWTPAMVAFRRTVFDVVGAFDEAVSPVADYDLYLRISRRFPIAPHGAVTVDYRQHGNNMSRDSVLMLDATLAVLRAQRAHLLSQPELTTYAQAEVNWRHCYGERLIARFRTALRERNWHSAVSAAFHLLRLYPLGVRRHLLKKARLVAGQRGGGNVSSPDSGSDATDHPRP